MAVYGFDKCKSKKEITPEAIGARRNDWMPTAGDVGAVEVERLGQATWADDLFKRYDVPTLVHWGGNTLNTPFKSGLTLGQQGFAIIHGDQSTGWHSVVAWQMGGDRARMWMHLVDGGVNHGWHDMTAYLPLTGGNVTGKVMFSGNSGGIEGGEIGLAKPPSNELFANDITIDVYDNQLRIFTRHCDEEKVFVINFAEVAGGYFRMFHTGSIFCGTAPMIANTNALTTDHIYQMVE